MLDCVCLVEVFFFFNAFSVSVIVQVGRCRSFLPDLFSVSALSCVPPVFRCLHTLCLNKLCCHSPLDQIVLCGFPPNHRCFLIFDSLRKSTFLLPLPVYCDSDHEDVEMFCLSCYRHSDRVARWQNFTASKGPGQAPMVNKQFTKHSGEHLVVSLPS